MATQMNYGPVSGNTAASYPPERDSNIRVEQSLTDVASLFQIVYSRCLDLGSRIGNLADFVAGGSTPTPNHGTGPREVPNGIVATLSETRQSISHLLDTIEPQVDRLSNSLGFDRSPGTR